MNCPFCKILSGNRERIIKEKKSVFVVLSNPRLVPGHLLVIPKRHVEKFSKLTKQEKEELFKTAIYFQEKILKKFASGCDLTQHYRPFIKQDKFKVNHLHLHLRPREFKDELYNKVQKFEKGIFKDLSKEEIKKFEKLFGE